MLNFNSIAGNAQSQPLYRTCTPVVGSVVVVVVVEAWRLELTRWSP